MTVLTIRMRYALRMVIASFWDFYAGGMWLILAILAVYVAQHEVRDELRLRREKHSPRT
jgi:hypothetical protein